MSKVILYISCILLNTVLNLFTRSPIFTKLKMEMKSFRVHSYDCQSVDFKSKYSIKKKDVSFNERPTPLDFDAFIPWFCLEFQVPKDVIVRRTSQAEYTRYSSKARKESGGTTKSKSRSTKTKSNTIKSEHTGKETVQVVRSSVPASLHEYDDKNTIVLTTCYDKRGHLVEISIIGCPFPIHKKVIRAINVCLPFHLKLSKFFIRKGGVDNLVLHEMAKLLPYSNITEVSLDDSDVPGANYSVLLQQSSKLKYLSLKRCGINDEECKKIALTLDINGSAAQTMLLLDLASNKIMDDGAQALGEILKSNRYLLYLNLSGNSISDNGAAIILKYLKEFPLSCNEIVDEKRRRLNYLKARTSIYENCLKEAKLAHSVTYKEASSPGSDDSKHYHGRKIKKTLPSLIVHKMSVEDIAEKKTREIMGDFEEPFKEENVRRKNHLVYSIGNLTLCSLNLAYNNLSLISVRKVLEVLNYQCGVNKPNESTGLLRVVIDGNKFPPQCNELDEILICLHEACVKREHDVSVISLTSTLSKRRI